MAKFTPLELERLDVVEFHMDRLLRLYKSKPRKGDDLKKLKRLEEISIDLAGMRLM